MMMRDLLADVLSQHKFDLDRSIDSEGMFCTCGAVWEEDKYTDHLWDLHLADQILSALAPTPRPMEQHPHPPLFEEDNDGN